MVVRVTVERYRYTPFQLFMLNSTGECEQTGRFKL